MKKRWSARKGKPDYLRLKEILKSDEILGREKFEERRRQFGRQRRDPEDEALEDQASKFDSNFMDDGTTNEDDRKIQLDQSTSTIEGKERLNGAEEYEELLHGEKMNAQQRCGNSTRSREDNAANEEVIRKVGGVNLSEEEEEETGRKPIPGKEDAQQLEMRVYHGKISNESGAYATESGAYAAESGAYAAESGASRVGNGDQECGVIVAEKRDTKEEELRFFAEEGEEEETHRVLAEEERDTKEEELKFLAEEKTKEEEREARKDVWRLAERRTVERMTLEKIQKMEPVLVGRCWGKRKASSIILDGQNSALEVEERSEEGKQKAEFKMELKTNGINEKSSTSVGAEPERDDEVIPKQRKSLVEMNPASSEVKPKRMVSLVQLVQTAIEVVQASSGVKLATPDVKPEQKGSISVLDVETTPSEVKTQNWLLRSLTDAKRRSGQRQSESSADAGIQRDIVSPDFDNGDSGIYGDLMKTGSFSLKQKSSTFDASCLPLQDAEETKAHWDCVLSSASGPESEYSIRISHSNSEKRQEIFKRLRSSVGNKWASFSSSFVKLRRQSRTNHQLPPCLPSNCGIEHVKVLQETVQAMQNCVLSLEGLELRLKEVLTESKSLTGRASRPSLLGEANNCLDDCFNDAAAANTKAVQLGKARSNRMEGKVITKEQLLTISTRLAKESKEFQRRIKWKAPLFLWMHLAKRMKKNGIRGEAETATGRKGWEAKGRKGWVYDAVTQLD